VELAVVLPVGHLLISQSVSQSVD